MSWVSDVLQFERSNFKDIWKDIKADPERVFIGAIDPFSSAMWSKITGKDYDPLINQMGGPTNERFESAEARGINSGPAQQAHSAAAGIAGMFAGVNGNQVAQMGQPQKINPVDPGMPQTNADDGTSRQAQINAQNEKKRKNGLHQLVARSLLMNNKR